MVQPAATGAAMAAPRSAAKRREFRDVLGARRKPGDGGVECGRGLAATEVAEERRHTGERDDQLRNVARLLESVDRALEQRQRSIRVTAAGVQPSGIARKEAAEEVDAVLVDDFEPFVPYGERVSGGGTGRRSPSAVRDRSRPPGSGPPL
jgi:hypothetical protein